MRTALLLAAGSLMLAGCGTGGGSAAAPTPSTSASAPSVTGGSPVTGTTQATPTAALTSSTTLQQSFDKLRSGVVRFEVAGCGVSWMGSGFQLSPDLVATVAHVVDKGQVIRVIEGTTSTAGRVIGLDQGTDVALVRTAVPLPGHTLDFADTAPAAGDQIAALGFPRGEPLSFNPGTVNGLGRKAEIEGYTRHDLLEMDAATNPGSSGGPVIRADGAVVGLVDAGPNPKGSHAGDQGERLAVSSATARTLIDRWRAAPQPPTSADCTLAVYPDGSPVPPEAFPTREDMQAVTTLSVYFDAINVGDFPTALAQLTHSQPLETFVAGVSSSADSAIDYRAVRPQDGTLVVWVTFTSRQDLGKGPAQRPQETCTNWSLDYVMAPKNGLWLIDATRAHDGAGNAPCPSDGSGAPPTGTAPTTSRRRRRADPSRRYGQAQSARLAAVPRSAPAAGSGSQTTLG